MAGITGAVSDSTLAGESSDSSDESFQLPLRVNISELLESRYRGGIRPEDWDLRKEGQDRIRTSDGQVLTLWSDAQQSPPQPGWVILLTDGDPEQGFRWTLYGIPPKST